MMWRRGYAVKPPPVSSFSPQYPGNDVRYNKYPKDIRISVSATTKGSGRWGGGSHRLRRGRRPPRCRVPLQTRRIEGDGGGIDRSLARTGIEGQRAKCRWPIPIVKFGDVEDELRRRRCRRRRRLGRVRMRSGYRLGQGTSLKAAARVLLQATACPYARNATPCAEGGG